MAPKPRIRINNVCAYNKQKCAKIIRWASFYYHWSNTRTSPFAPFCVVKKRELIVGQRRSRSKGNVFTRRSLGCSELQCGVQRNVFVYYWWLRKQRMSGHITANAPWLSCEMRSPLPLVRTIHVTKCSSSPSVDLWVNLKKVKLTFKIDERQRVEE